MILDFCGITLVCHYPSPAFERYLVNEFGDLVQHTNKTIENPNITINFIPKLDLPDSWIFRYGIYIAISENEIGILNRFGEPIAQVFFTEDKVTIFCKTDINPDWLYQSIVEPLLFLLLSMSGHVPLHSGAVTWDANSCLLLCGWTGIGKTELVSRLVNQGASYLSDDWVFITEESTAFPYPSQPRFSMTTLEACRDIMDQREVKWTQARKKMVLHSVAREPFRSVHYRAYRIGSVFLITRRKLRPGDDRSIRVESIDNHIIAKKMCMVSSYARLWRSDAMMQLLSYVNKNEGLWTYKPTFEEERILSKSLKECSTWAINAPLTADPSTSKMIMKEILERSEGVLTT